MWCTMHMLFYCFKLTTRRAAHAHAARRHTRRAVTRSRIGRPRPPTAPDRALRCIALRSPSTVVRVDIHCVTCVWCVVGPGLGPAAALGACSKLCIGAMPPRRGGHPALLPPAKLLPTLEMPTPPYDCQRRVLDCSSSERSCGEEARGGEAASNRQRRAATAEGGDGATEMGGDRGAPRRATRAPAAAPRSGA